MNSRQFQELCRDTCRELRIADPQGLAAGKAIEVDGFDMALVFDEALSPDKLYCYVDLGPIDIAERPAAHTRLLELNLLTGTRSNGVFALDAASGHAILVVHLHSPQALDEAQLARSLRLFAAQARATRESFSPARVGAVMAGAEALLLRKA